MKKVEDPEHTEQGKEQADREQEGIDKGSQTNTNSAAIKAD